MPTSTSIKHHFISARPAKVANTTPVPNGHMVSGEASQVIVCCTQLGRRGERWYVTRTQLDRRGERWYVTRTCQSEHTSLSQIHQIRRRTKWPIQHSVSLRPSLSLSLSPLHPLLVCLSILLSLTHSHTHTHTHQYLMQVYRKYSHTQTSK